jgi:hypothetical protein
MKPEVLLEQLETAAEKLKVRVSYEALQSSVVHGGLCRVKGEYRVIVDKRATAEERMTTLATALAQVVRQTEVDLTQLELTAKVREALRMYAPAAPGPKPVRPAAVA